MGFWGGLLIGLFIGDLMGIFEMALCAAARDAYDSEEDENE